MDELAPCNASRSATNIIQLDVWMHCLIGSSRSGRLSLAAHGLAPCLVGHYRTGSAEYRIQRNHDSQLISHVMESLGVIFLKSQAHSKQKWLHKYLSWFLIPRKDSRGKPRIIFWL
jgi:hypothetical protein